MSEDHYCRDRDERGSQPEEYLLQQERAAKEVDSGDVGWVETAPAVRHSQRIERQGVRRDKQRAKQNGLAPLPEEAQVKEPQHRSYSADDGSFHKEVGKVPENIKADHGISPPIE